MISVVSVCLHVIFTHYFLSPTVSHKLILITMLCALVSPTCRIHLLVDFIHLQISPTCTCLVLLFAYTLYWRTVISHPLRHRNIFKPTKLGTYSDWGLSSVLVINKHLSHHPRCFALWFHPLADSPTCISLTCRFHLVSPTSDFTNFLQEHPFMVFSPFGPRNIPSVKFGKIIYRADTASVRFQRATRAQNRAKPVNTCIVNFFIALPGVCVSVPHTLAFTLCPHIMLLCPHPVPHIMLLCLERRLWVSRGRAGEIPAYVSISIGSHWHSIRLHLHWQPSAFVPKTAQNIWTQVVSILVKRTINQKKSFCFCNVCWTWKTFDRFQNVLRNLSLRRIL